MGLEGTHSIPCPTNLLTLNSDLVGLLQLTIVHSRLEWFPPVYGTEMWPSG